MPYWNWTTFRQLPPGFTDAIVGGKTNALFHSPRAMGKTDTLSTVFGAAAETIFGQANIESMLAEKRFQAFGSFKPTGQNSTDEVWQRRGGSGANLESGPHDYGHGAVGGDMGSVATSPNDPIFYLHHCNIDRIWAHWNGAGNVNEADPHWTNFPFRKNFPKPNGSAGDDVKVSSMGDTRAIGYEYDDQPPPAPAPASAAIAFDLKGLGVSKLSQPIAFEKASTVAFQRTGAFDEKVKQVVSAPPAQEERLLVRINDVTPPADPRVSVRVFLNCDYLTPMTPTDDPRYAGSFTFFVLAGGDGGDHSAHGGATRSFAIDVTETVKNLKTLGLDPNEDLKVQLMPVGYGGAPVGAEDFKVGSIEIATV